MKFENTIVFAGKSLQPRHCPILEINDGVISRLEPGDEVMSIDEGALVIIPGLVNAHTHMGDSILPDGATGLTLEQGFFRPNGYKYRELAKIPRQEHLEHVTAHLRYMARTGTVCHLDFREQGPYGSELLREASKRSGVRSVVLGQFNGVPFTQDQLTDNQMPLSGEDLDELKRMLLIADGFSESTMNDLTNPAWETIRSLTEELGKMRAIHCLENEGYRSESLRIDGKGDLARAIELLDPHIIVHLTVATAEEIALLKKSGIPGVLNPRANANLGLPIPPIGDLLKAGIRLLLGTDNGLLNSPNMFAELDYTFKLCKSQFGDALNPDPLEILKLATVNVNGVLQGSAVEPHYGYLDEGLPADFVVLNFQQPHLRRSRHLPASVVTRVTPEDVLATYYKGQAIYQA